MKKLATRLTWVAALLAATSCQDPLSVRNEQNPDVQRALATPAEVEQFISTLHQLIHNGVHGSSTSLTSQMAVMSLASYGSVANFGMGTRGTIPRTMIDNSRNNIADGGNLRDFSHMSRRSRDASDAIQALDKILAEGRFLGNPGQDNVALNQRARAFAMFASGVSLGYLSMAYDSAAIVTHQTAPAGEVPEPLSHYTAVHAAALAQLDSAERIAASASAAGAFPLPQTWIRTPGATGLTQDQLVRVIRSFRARIRAGVARTPTERAAVDWTKVIADASTGIQSDFLINLDASAWVAAFDASQIFQDNSRGWHQLSLMYYGMADTSGMYENFIATPLAQRNGQAAGMLIKTPDRRFPSGETRAAQQASSLSNTQYTGFVFPYIRNRSSADSPSADQWAHSFYDFYRWRALREGGAGGVGPWTEIAKVEMDMLVAEGHIRAGNPGLAAPLIDASRARAGLVPFASQTSSNCVPRVPVGPNFNTTACGDLMEAMKWEKRMETAYTGYGQWFFDARGWGDLVEGTGLHWPVPNQELDARGKPLYSLGGVGGQASAGKGTYGF